MITLFEKFDNFIFGEHFIGTLEDLTDESKNTLLKIFGTLKFPYKIQIYNSEIKYIKKNIAYTQDIEILDVDVYILKKILKVSFLSCGNIFQQFDKININFVTGDIYSGNEFSINHRKDDGRLSFSIPVARYEDNKWKIFSGQDEFQFISDDKVSLTQKDLNDIKAKKTIKRFNL